MAGALFGLFALLIKASAFFGFFAFLLEAGPLLLLKGSLLLELRGSLLLFAGVCFCLFAFPFFGFFALLLKARAFFGFFAFLLEAGPVLLLEGSLLFAGAFFRLFAFLFPPGAFFGFLAFPLLAGQFYRFPLLLEVSAVFLLAGAILLEFLCSLPLITGLSLGLFAVLKAGAVLEARMCFRLFALTLLTGASLGSPLPILEFLLEADALFFSAFFLLDGPLLLEFCRSLLFLASAFLQRAR